MSIISNPEDTERITRYILKNTPTLGVRVSQVNRYRLKRRVKNVKTSLGKVRIKVAEIDGKTRYSIEYQDLRRIADKKKISIDEVEKKINLEINRIYGGSV